MGMLGLWGPNRKAASVPSAGYLAGLHSWEAPGLPDRGSQACFSPVFDLELDTRAHTSSSHLRCFSHQQLDEDTEAPTSLLQQLLALCRCSSPAQAQLLQHVQRLRSEACTLGASSSAAGVSLPAAGCCAGTCGCSCLQGSATHSSCCGQGSASHTASRAVAVVDVEALACELLALGYMVQVRDGAAQQERSKKPRSCLQSLRHRFIVCLGVRSAADREPAYLPEPLVVEPRFREQFTIAHPTPEYEALLQSVPACFVGSVPDLEGVVTLVCEQMTATFKLQGLPVPPWRTRTALLSKWGPQQLSELSAKIANLRRLAAAVPASSRAIVPCQSHEHLFNSNRPAAAHADHAAVGSAPSSAAQTLPGMQPVPAPTQQLPTWDLNVTANSQQPGGGDAAAAMAAGNGMPGETLFSSWQQLQQQQQQQGCQQHTAGPLGRLAQPGINKAVAVCSGVPVDVVQHTPPATVDKVLAMLTTSNSVGPQSSTALRFTRNASAEWKHHRTSSRKTKGLLAAALNKPKVGSRGNLLMLVSGTADVPAGQTALTSGPAAAHPAPPGSDAPPIRRTHFRAACDEPWRRITTVRLGVYPQQQAAASQL